MPKTVILEIWSSNGTMFSRNKKLATLPLDVPGGRKKNTTGGGIGDKSGSNSANIFSRYGDNDMLSVTSISPMKVKYSFSSFEPMPEAIASRVNFSMLSSSGNNKFNNNSDSDDNDNDNDNDNDTDMTQFIRNPRKRYTSGEAIVTTAWAVDTMGQNPQNKNNINNFSNNVNYSENLNDLNSVGNPNKSNKSNKSNVIQYQHKTSVLYPVPSHDTHLNLGNKIIGGPIIPAYMEGKPTISIVGGAEFYDTDLMDVISRVPHIDPNNPENSVLMDIMSHTRRSFRFGEYYRACKNSGHNSSAQFKSTNRLNYEPPRRHILLALRKHRKQQFEQFQSGSKPIPLTDSEILNDPYYKTLLSNYAEEQRLNNLNRAIGSAVVGAAGGGGINLFNKNDENSTDDFFFEEILRKQKLRVQSFNQRVQRAQKALAGSSGRYNFGRNLKKDAYVKEGILPNFNFGALNIVQIFKPKRRLKPPSTKRQQIAKPVQCRLRVHIVNAINVPTRFNETTYMGGNGLSSSMAAPSSPSRRNRRQQEQRSDRNNHSGDDNNSNNTSTENDEFSDDEYDSELASNLASFVGIEFQGEEYHTSTRFGANPRWNEPVDIPFVPHGIEGTSYTPRNLASIGDPIKISLFDERVIQNVTEKKYREGVSYRNERRYLGGVTIPFSTVYVNERIHGALPLKKPVLTLGYRASGQIIEGENITPLEERSRCDTLLKCVISVDPPLVSYQPESQLNVLNTNGETKQIRAAAKFFLKSLGTKASGKNIQLCCSDINARSVLVCRYISPQIPPPEIFQPLGNNGGGNTLSEEDTIQSIVRYVSLIPFRDDWSVFGGETNDVWCSSQQFLELGCGDWEEHAILLCNFLNYYDQSKRTGQQSYIVLGRGLPEGDTVYTLRMDPTLGGLGSDISLFNASTGRGYSGKDRNCPLLHVDMIANGENIWVNIQQGNNETMGSHPSKMVFDLEDPKLFKKFFTNKNIIPDTINYVNNAELKHIAPDIKNASMMERELQETLKNQFREWRQDNKKGGLKTYTRFDQNISMELKPLLESFENAKREMNGFSEDSAYFTLFVSLLILFCWYFPFI
jgi:hypothetical protein